MQLKEIVNNVSELIKCSLKNHIRFVTMATHVWQSAIILKIPRIYIHKNATG